MRNLTQMELGHVSGGAGSCYCPCPPSKDDHGKKYGHNKMKMGNNGFGNDGHDGVPGNSGKQDKTR